MAAAMLYPLPGHSADALPSAQLERLSHHRQWLDLLHFEQGRPTFISPSFYLTEAKTPFAELKALVQQANMPITDEKAHPRCRFPARYEWLGRQLDRPDWRTPPAACRKLHKWLGQHRLTGVSIMLVSGYMGNPASLFGHAFLRLETADQSADLWQTSLSYGARVPDGENTLRYVYRGLTGGYDANYTDRYFYNQDLTYTRTEARDMWAYPMELTPDQLRRLQMHIWEVTNQRKRYYFLTHNCAYELGRLLQGALTRPTMQPARLWYLPEQLVIQAQQAGLTGQPVYHPAAERRLIWHYRQLSDDLKKRANAFMNAESTLNDTLEGLSSSQMLKLLNFLLAYQHFLTMQQMPTPSQQTRRLRHQLLLKRLSLPPGQTSTPVPARPSPLDGERATRIWSGAATDSSGRLHGLIGGSPYNRPPEGINLLEGDELTLLWAEARFNQDAIELEQLDYIRILHHALSPLPKASPWSWRLLLRSERLSTGRYDHQAHFGAGRSLRAGNTLLYALLTPAVHSVTPQLRLQASVGLIVPLTPRTRLHMTGGLENGQDSLTGLGTLTLHQQISAQFSWSLQGRWRSDQLNNQALVRLQWHF